jgi:hypothetical protein
MIFIAWDQEKSANVTAGKRSFADDLFSIIDETWLEQSQIEFGRDEFVEVDDGSIALPEDSMPVPWGKGAPRQSYGRFCGAKLEIRRSAAHLSTIAPDSQ